MPLWQVSVCVQALPSSHGVLLDFATAEQAPFDGLQVPTLHWSLWALQSTGVPGLHWRVAMSHVLIPSQALPFSQSASFVQPQGAGSKVHRACVLLQPSVVQAMPSLHTRAGPPHVPAVQVSGFVQNTPSSHGVPLVFCGFEQRPVDMLQVPAVWHWSSAMHCTGVPFAHAPAWHDSPFVHGLPSLHGVPFGFAGFTGQDPPEQLAWMWHWSATGQTVPIPPMHDPP